MKNIYLIGGTMGVGKTTICQNIKGKLIYSVFLDGDWCWDMHPFQVTEETKQMVVENICFLLNNFIKCSAYENIVFCWVMHLQTIIDDIVSCLDTTNCNVHSISLICSEKALQTRLRKDVDSGIRTENIIGRSIEYLSLYDKLSTYKVDVSNIIPEQAADFIIQNC
ncbi:MAG: AAA family ATPase [Mobilitalea sp.]